MSTLPWRFCSRPRAALAAALTAWLLLAPPRAPDTSVDRLLERQMASDRGGERDLLDARGARE